MSIRVYLPGTLERLDAWHTAGEVPADVEPVVAEDDTEESEYDALMAAADASRALGPGKRVVVVAEVPTAGGAVSLSRVVAVHVDTDDDADDDDDLAWFATQEIPFLLR